MSCRRQECTVHVTFWKSATCQISFKRSHFEAFHCTVAGKKECMCSEQISPFQPGPSSIRSMIKTTTVQFDCIISHLNTLSSSQSLQAGGALGASFSVALVIWASTGLQPWRGHGSITVLNKWLRVEPWCMFVPHCLLCFWCLWCLRPGELARFQGLVLPQAATDSEHLQVVQPVLENR